MYDLRLGLGLGGDLAGRVALVTGATGQLGRTMVRTLARAGADMAVHYRGNRAKAESLCEEVRQMGGRAVAVFAEVDSEESVNAMRDAIVDALGTSPGSEPLWMGGQRSGRAARGVQ